MPFSMSTQRAARMLPRTSGPQPVTVWGYGADGGADDLPVVVARGSVHVWSDGPGQCVITAPEGVVYETAEWDWTLLKHEWTVEARKREA